MQLAFLAPLLGLSSGVLVVSLTLGLRNREKRHAYVDTAIFLAVFFTFLLYPALCQRLLRLYRRRQFGELELLAADPSIDFNSEVMVTFRSVGGIFISARARFATQGPPWLVVV